MSLADCQDSKYYSVNKTSHLIISVSYLIRVLIDAPISYIFQASKNGTKEYIDTCFEGRTGIFPCSSVVCIRLFP